MAGQHEIDGRQRPYPAETANRWVNQLGPILLEFPDGDLRPIHELVGEYHQKSQTFLYPDSVLPRTRLGGAFPEIRSRRPRRDHPLGGVDPIGVEAFRTYAHLGMALRTLGTEARTPDGQWLTYTDEDFFHDWGYDPWDAQEWIEQTVRGLRLRTFDGHLPRERDTLAVRRREGRRSSVPFVSAEQILEAEQEQRRLGKGTLLMAGIAGGTVAVVASACAPVTPSPQPTRIPTFPSPSPEATRTPQPFSLLEATPTLESRGFTPPVNPPEYLPEAAGGAFPESIREVAELDFYRALETIYRQEEGPFLTTNLAEYQQFLRTYATQNRLDVRQVWNGEFGDRYQLVSAIIKRLPTAREAVYWYATPGGALSARPDIPSTAESTLVPVELPSGTHADFRWNNEDRHVYLFAVDNRTDEAMSWFNSTIADAARVDGLAPAFESVVKEVLPTSCLVPEMNQQVVDEFLRDFGYRSLESAYSVFEKSGEFDPFISWSGLQDYTSKWDVGRRYLLLGGARISLAHLRGSTSSDYAQCMFLAHPSTGDRIYPIIMAVNRRGTWGLTTSITDPNHLGYYDLDLGRWNYPLSIESQEDLERWISETRGRGVTVGIVLRFRNPGDWNREQSNNPFYDPPSVVKEVMDVLGPDSYLQLYTSHPDQLGRQSPDGYGEHAGPSAVLERLDPTVDVGFFPDIVYTPFDYSR